MISEKCGALGGGVLMVTRVLMVIFIAFIIFGIASVFYAYHIDVRDAEAAIMGRNVVKCLASDGVFDFDDYPDGELDKLLIYCGFGDAELGRVFARVVFTSGGNELARLYQGDSGTLWVREIFKNKGVNLGEGLGQYEPGYFNWDYSVFVLKDGARVDAKMNVEVLMQHDK